MHDTMDTFILHFLATVAPGLAAGGVGSPKMIGHSARTRTDQGALRYQAGARVRICVCSSGQSPGRGTTAHVSLRPLVAGGLGQSGAGAISGAGLGLRTQRG